MGFRSQRSFPAWEPDGRAETEAGTDELDRACAERAALIELCVYAMDRSHSSGVTEKLIAGLDRVGVVRSRPDGERFDPSCHEAGGTVPTDDPEWDGWIAVTELPGFRDRGRVLRAPVVTVYRLRDSPASTSGGRD
jgi:molecular chaperone GrpE (heat shock protein)